MAIALFTRKSPVTHLLEAQHRAVEELFKKLESPETATRAVVDELANSLAAHMTIEQEIYYPTARKIDEDRVRENYEEHAISELALKRLIATDTTDGSFGARVEAVKELIEHHVKEEERNLFPTVDKHIDHDELAVMAETMRVRFDMAFSAGFAAVVPVTGSTRTSADSSRA